ncbi:MAG: 2TM domain-containing protein [Candidatus Lokiarchaeota archaeon]|nr:2TM domain-containing protein [Candidatus Lokiarchaeota archaeon]
MKIFNKDTYHRRTHEEAKKVTESKRLSEFDDTSIAHISKEIVIRRTVLIGHFVVFVFINILLFVLNYFIDFTYQWYPWALSGMLFLLLVHSSAYFIFRRGFIYIATESIVAHTFLYVIGNAFLFFINWYANLLTARPFPSWAWWSLGCWTAALILHIIIYLMIVPLNHEPKDARWLERKVYSEMFKYQKRRKQRTNNLEQRERRVE